MRKLDFSQKACIKIEYQRHLYLICPDSRGWYIQRFETFWDYARPWGNPGQIISDYFEDPQALLREVTIENRTLDEILREMPEFSSPLPLFAYNYERFLTDIMHHSEFIFYFREKYYFIDYWGTVEGKKYGWIFIAEQNGEVLISGEDFDEFVKQVDLWMVKNVGVSLRKMFNEHYKEDQTGELEIESIYYSGP
jgi:hypothetical protein